MPPQQGYRLPDFVDDVLRFRAHGCSFCPVLEMVPCCLETVWKFYSGGHLMAFSALPVLTDPNVRCAPVLETTTI
ncbi:conserved hypothetical protein [Mesorhizobium metallidurans STM 2683]|uniref:Uncharacterized protein n=1 Tax=Mesorhizobium metallidurans STM 2683 TaxID=1297569 RepID=M5EPJ6_9HYPH|nr:conserved hypothetical protein [Mesorhizobium metallidurans STM 2683]